jgi:ABC-type glutathione transport system ATPase component
VGPSASGKTVFKQALIKHYPNLEGKIKMSNQENVSTRNALLIPMPNRIQWELMVPDAFFGVHNQISEKLKTLSKH